MASGYEIRVIDRNGHAWLQQYQWVTESETSGSMRWVDIYEIPMDHVARDQSRGDKTP